MPSPGRKYVGAMAQLSLDAIKRADQMQFLATERIGTDFETRDPEQAEPRNPGEWSFEEWLQAAEQATAEGKGAEFDVLMATVLAPMIDQVLSGQAAQ